MKKILMIFGGLCAVILLLVIILIAVLAYTGRGLDQESKAYADAAVVAIASHWNENDFVQRASPQLMDKIKDAAGLHKLMASLRSLGPLRNYEGSKGESHIALIFPSGETVTAFYVAKVEFDSGPADIKLSLIKLDGVWKILGFYVNQDKYSTSGPNT